MSVRLAILVLINSLAWGVVGSALTVAALVYMGVLSA